jgi:hypothetical protein
MGWQAIGSDERRLIRTAVEANIDAILGAGARR